jgi:hypothetical protein
MLTYICDNFVKRDLSSQLGSGHDLRILEMESLFSL